MELSICSIGFGVVVILGTFVEYMSGPIHLFVDQSYDKDLLQNFSSTANNASYRM
jgi:hypothetical protein